MNLYRYVIQIRKKGGRQGDRVLWYWHRKPYPLVRLGGNPAESETDAALVLSLNKKADAGVSPGLSPGLMSVKTSPVSLHDLWDCFTQSREYAVLSAGTHRVYQSQMRTLTRYLGDVPLDTLSPVVLRSLRVSMASTPMAFNGAISLLSTMYAWAIDNGHAHDTPTRDIRKYPIVARARVMSVLEERLVRGEASARLDALITMALLTCQRLSDLLAIKHTDLETGVLRIKQRKTGTPISIPLPPDLVIPKGDGIRPFPIGPRVATREFHDACVRAGVEGLTFHDLRRTGMVRLAEAGATPIEIAAVSGHSINSSQKMLDVYVPRSEEMARLAMAKLSKQKPELG